MGAIHYRVDEVRLDELMAVANGIALVHPDDPPFEVQDVGGDPGPSDVPTSPRPRARLVWERLVVDAWLRPPFDEAPAAIEVWAPGNARSLRDAMDAATGMLGHVHHVELVPRLVDVPGWEPPPRDGARIAFVTRRSDRGWDECHDGLSLPVTARALVEARLPPPAPPRRRWWWPF